MSRRNSRPWAAIRLVAGSWSADHCGGVDSVQDAPAGYVLVYIDSDDIEADLKKVQQLGGTVVQPKTEIPNIGWFGMFKDPTGNVLALYTSANPQVNQ